MSLESTKKKGRKALHGAKESTVLTHCAATSSVSTSSASARNFAGASTCVAATMTNFEQQRDGEGAEGEIGGDGVDEQPTPITIALQEQVSSLSGELRTAQAQLAEQSRTIAKLLHDMAAIKQAMQQ